jgi:hypothetical protein
MLAPDLVVASTELDMPVPSWAFDFKGFRAADPADRTVRNYYNMMKGFLLRGTDDGRMQFTITLVTLAYRWPAMLLAVMSLLRADHLEERRLAQNLARRLSSSAASSNGDGLYIMCTNAGDIVMHDGAAANAVDPPAIMDAISESEYEPIDFHSPAFSLPDIDSDTCPESEPEIPDDIDSDTCPESETEIPDVSPVPSHDIDADPDSENNDMSEPEIPDVSPVPSHDIDADPDSETNAMLHPIPVTPSGINGSGPAYESDNDDMSSDNDVGGSSVDHIRGSFWG